MTTPDRAAARVVRNTTSLAFAQIVTMGASFVLAPWLIHAFGAAAYGAVMLVAAIGAFTSLLHGRASSSRRSCGSASRRPRRPSCRRSRPTPAASWQGFATSPTRAVPRQQWPPDALARVDRETLAHVSRFVASELTPDAALQALLPVFMAGLGLPREAVNVHVARRDHAPRARDADLRLFEVLAFETRRMEHRAARGAFDAIDDDGAVFAMKRLVGGGFLGHGVGKRGRA